MGEDGQVVRGAEELGLFKGLEGFFKEPHAAGAHLDLAAEGPTKYPTKEMDSKFRDEEVPGANNWSFNGPVHYFDDSARLRHLLEARDGRLYDADGRPFDTSTARSPHRASDGRAIYVMDEDGNIYASNFQPVGLIQHSSFLAGLPVAGAGEIRVIDGIPELLTARSGHYKVSADMTRNVEAQLKRMGVDMSRAHISYAPRPSLRM